MLTSKKQVTKDASILKKTVKRHDRVQFNLKINWLCLATFQLSLISATIKLCLCSFFFFFHHWTSHRRANTGCKICLGLMNKFVWLLRQFLSAPYIHIAHRVVSHRNDVNGFIGSYFPSFHPSFHPSIHPIHPRASLRGCLPAIHTVDRVITVRQGQNREADKGCTDLHVVYTINRRVNVWEN